MLLVAYISCYPSGVLSKRVRAAGVLLLCLGAVIPAAAGCSAPAHPAPQASSSPALIEPSGPNDVDTDVPHPLASPTWDQAGRDQATTTATKVMTVFVDHRQDGAAWWADLEPMFSPLAAADYTGTDPAQVPAHQVSGPAALVDQSSAFLATVSVPTDVGAYQVLLSRTGAGQPWLVERLSPPDAVSAG